MSIAPAPLDRVSLIRLKPRLRYCQMCGYKARHKDPTDIGK